MNTATQYTPTVSERAHLKRASIHPLGHLPNTVTRKLLRSLHDSGFIYRENVDGFRLDADEAFTYEERTPWRVTPTGRLAALTPAQLTALAERVDSTERFTPRVTWATTRALTELGLAEYRDADGQVHPNDGDDGVSGPQYRSYRTALGRTVVDLASRVKRS
jgi:hypothetical protein